MSRGTLRWITIAIVAAMVGTLAIGLTAGGGDSGATAPSSDGRSATTGTDEATAATGPHVLLELCSASTGCPEPDEADQEALVAELEADPRVASVLLVSSEQVYQLFLDRFGDNEEMVQAVDPATVPAQIELDLYDPDIVAEVAASYEQHEMVARVRDARAAP